MLSPLSPHHQRDEASAMTSKMFDLIGDPAIMKEVAQIASKYGAQASEPMPTESISDPLDAPIGADEIRSICEVVTIVANTGVSIVAFLAAVKALLANSETTDGSTPKIEVRETKTQKKICDIDSNTIMSDLSV